MGSRLEELTATLSANVLTEDGLLLRTCQHGIQHPVGRFTGTFRESEVVNSVGVDGKEILTQRHAQRVPPAIGHSNAACDGCCADYKRHEFSR